VTFTWDAGTQYGSYAPYAEAKGLISSTASQGIQLVGRRLWCCYAQAACHHQCPNVSSSGVHNGPPLLHCRPGHSARRASPCAMPACR
jgi:hypothetical protein